jgi:hypothetical protein
MLNIDYLYASGIANANGDMKSVRLKGIAVLTGHLAINRRPLKDIVGSRVIVRDNSKNSVGSTYIISVLKNDSVSTR